VTNFRLVKADRAHHKFIFSLAVFCFFFFPLYAQWVFAAADIYIYKDKNGVLSFTSVPTHARYTRVIRSEGKPKTSVQSPQADPEGTFVRLFRLKDTDEIGYWDGEKFVPLWPETYTKLMGDNTAFANPNEFEDIWVNGLSEQVGPIKMRKGLPPAVTAAKEFYGLPGLNVPELFDLKGLRLSTFRVTQWRASLRTTLSGWATSMWATGTPWPR
jgi:uncharacterized protein DUF4124